MIPFCKTYKTGKESIYINEVIESGHISGNSKFTKACHNFFQKRYAFKRSFLTTSGTSALEMAAILLNIKEGDEIIIPSYTFSATANAFLLRGAKVVFADSSFINPNIDSTQIEKLINKKTRAIVVVHYAGVACDMDEIVRIAKTHKLVIIEDAAHAIDAYHKDQPLGGIGDLSAFSFHQTKNIVAGECGMLAINNESFIERAECIWENGTNRAAFKRGDVDKYTWVDIGASFLSSELSAAFLLAQLEQMDSIQNRRKEIWKTYYKLLSNTHHEDLSIPVIPSYAQHNAHMFYILCRNQKQRDKIISYLRSSGIYAVFHYNSLHKSPYFSPSYSGTPLVNADNYSEKLVRLPLFVELQNDQIQYICDKISSF